MTRNQKVIRVELLKNQAVIADLCIVAESFFARLKGLIGTRGMVPGEGLLLTPCNEIHMWFMSIPIDVVFLESEKNLSQNSSQLFYRVTSLRRNLPPWKILPIRDWKANDTLELPVGTIERCQINVGDQVCIS